MEKLDSFAKVRRAALDLAGYRLVVAEAQDDAVLEAVVMAKQQGMVEPILVGQPEAIKPILKKLETSPDAFRIIPSSTPEESARLAVQLVHEGEGDALLKGFLPTSTLMREVLNRDYGLRTGQVMSHTMFYEVPGHPGFIVNTDGGMLTFPTLEQKRGILENAAKLLKKLGYDKIYAACLAGSEQVDPKIEASLDAAELAAEKERWAKLNMTVYGPVALDLAVSEEAVRHKHYEAEGAGKADIILMPNFLVGNAFGKTLTYFAGADSAGLINGAKVPIILVSRVDSAKIKLNSLALAALAAQVG